MSGRRERGAPLTGRSNYSANQLGDSMPQNLAGAGGSARSNNLSARSDNSVISTNEMLRRLREEKEKTTMSKAQAEIDCLGDYNAFSRPRPSQTVPLRSCLLDPEVNNFPPSKTRSELMKRIRYRSIPHPSYDVDCDGFVSTSDYRFAKRFDLDGNGVLDPEERKICKQVLADEFFKSHKHDIGNFGESFARNSHKKNVDNLANAHSFERSYEVLKQAERTLNATSAKTINECMRAPDDTLTRHNFFSNKFDTTAWNDMDAIPRSVSTTGLDDHAGSRKRLMFIRREISRVYGDEKMRTAVDAIPKVNTKRSNLITNVAVENN